MPSNANKISSSSFRAPYLTTNTDTVFVALIVLAALLLGLIGGAMDKAFVEGGQKAVSARLHVMSNYIFNRITLDKNGKFQIPVPLNAAAPEIRTSELFARITSPTQSWHSYDPKTLQLPSTFPEHSTHKTAVFNINNQSFYIIHMQRLLHHDQQSVPVTLTLALDMTYFDSGIRDFRWILWSGLVLCVVILLTAILIIIATSVRPLKRLAKELRAIESGQQDSLGGVYPKEIEYMSEHVNRVIKHRTVLFQRYRIALSDLSHAIKTPLSVLRASAEKKLFDNLEDIVLEQVDRMSKIIEYHLQRAAAAEQALGTENINVHHMAETITNTLNIIYAREGKSCTINIKEDIYFEIIWGDLFEIMGNLLENSFKWCQQHVTISAEQGLRYEREYLSITVEDDGPGMEAEEAERLMQRWVRGDPTTEGHGIGLSIVNAISDSHDGNVEVARSNLGGAKITVLIYAKLLAAQ